MSKWRKRSSVGATVLLLGAAISMTGGEAKAQTVLTNNDGIIRNSLCVGFDCPNSINFGFDTIRMMENNTRISFVDTSSGSFPTRDWHLTANSHQSGGLSYFGIRDCGDSSSGEAECGTRVFAVQAGARADAIFATSNRVGFGTSSPVLELHTRDGDSPGLRLEQDGSSGFSPQTWDMAGNEANFFIRDVTNGSLLPFRIRPGAPTSSIDIAANGNVGIGTASPDSDLQLTGSSAQFMRFETTGGTSPATWEVGDAGNGTFKISEVGVTGVQMRVTGEGMLHVRAVASPPTTNVQLGAIYNDTSGALCWFDGSAWLVVAGTGNCS